MKKTLMSLATVGLLLSAGAAFSQNTETKTQTPAGSATTQSQINTKSGERSSSRTEERREGQRSERREGGSRANVTVRGDRDGMRHRDRGSRTSVNVRIRGGEGYGYRRHHHRMGVYVGGCRTIIVKKWHHGHRVIKRIRTCR
jgi:hypothetical protein